MLPDPTPDTRHPHAGRKDKLMVVLAQGLGAGRLPLGPGTWGSLAGLLWFALLLLLPNLGLFVISAAGAAAVSPWICGEAERLLKQRDPPSVVFDEIIAIPLCFLLPLIADQVRYDNFRGVEAFFGTATWTRTAIVFALFRFFDIAKPWPVRQSQRLPAGWGVTVDDLLAALYVNLVQLPFLAGDLLSGIVQK